jgi:hypothetical protein
MPSMAAFRDEVYIQYRKLQSIVATPWVSNGTKHRAKFHSCLLQSVVSSKECLCILVAWHITAYDVTEVLSTLFITVGMPEYIRSDNGPEVTAKALREWFSDLG